jgi:hypothetical protein
MRSETVTPVPSRRELIREVHVFAKADTTRGVALFLLDLGLYAAAMAGVLFLSSLWAKVASSISAGMVLGRMFSLAHNAAHENIVNGQRLNRFMAIVLFTPIFYNYRLWVYEHHTLHHPFPNDTKSDAYTPYSKQEYDALPAWRRALERFYRAPTVIGWGIYYIVERHFSTKIYPPAYVPPRLRPAAYWNTALVAVYAAALFALLIAAAALRHKPDVTRSPPARLRVAVPGVRDPRRLRASTFSTPIQESLGSKTMSIAVPKAYRVPVGAHGSAAIYGMVLPRHICASRAPPSPEDTLLPCLQGPTIAGRAPWLRCGHQQVWGFLAARHHATLQALRLGQSSMACLRR